MITEIHLHPAASLSVMPLSMACQGQTVTVTQINGSQVLRQRLLDLGLNLGARIHVVKNEMTGPLILAVKEDGRLALGRGMTHHVLVTPIAAAVNGG
ncbi:MAG: ferrous iron transport protein A [Caldilineales bacterium]